MNQVIDPYYLYGATLKYELRNLFLNDVLPSSILIKTIMNISSFEALHTHNCKTQ